MPNNFLTLNGTISGSLSLSDGLELGDNPINIGQVSILPSGNIGDLVVSGSNLYFYNGSDWMEMYGTSITTPTPTPTPEPEPTPTPRPPVDFTINISNSPFNSVLQNVGGFYVDNANDVIIAKTATNTFISLSSICTHTQGNPPVLDYQHNNNRFLCPSFLCTFSTTGTVLSGPATTPLKTYTTFLSGSLLRVYENDSITPTPTSTSIIPTPTPTIPTPTATLTYDPIVFTIDIDPGDGNYPENIYPVIGTSQNVNVQISSILPSSGVSIDVFMRKVSDNTTAFETVISSNNINNNITVTGIIPGVLYQLYVVVTSNNDGLNTATKYFKIASK